MAARLEDVEDADRDDRGDRGDPPPPPSRRAGKRDAAGSSVAMGAVAFAGVIDPDTLDLVRACGGRVSTKVTTTLDALVVGKLATGHGRRLDEAWRFEVPIVDEAELRKCLSRDAKDGWERLRNAPESAARAERSGNGPFRTAHLQAGVALAKGCTVDATRRLARAFLCIAAVPSNRVAQSHASCYKPREDEEDGWWNAYHAWGEPGILRYVRGPRRACKPPPKKKKAEPVAPAPGKKRRRRKVEAAPAPTKRIRKRARVERVLSAAAVAAKAERREKRQERKAKAAEEAEKAEKAGKEPPPKWVRTTLDHPLLEGPSTVPRNEAVLRTINEEAGAMGELMRLVRCCGQREVYTKAEDNGNDGEKPQYVKDVPSEDVLVQCVARVLRLIRVATAAVDLMASLASNGAPDALEDLARFHSDCESRIACAHAWFMPQDGGGAYGHCLDLQGALAKGTLAAAPLALLHLMHAERPFGYEWKALRSLLFYLLGEFVDRHDAKAVHDVLPHLTIALNDPEYAAARDLHVAVQAAFGCPAAVEALKTNGERVQTRDWGACLPGHVSMPYMTEDAEGGAVRMHKGCVGTKVLSLVLAHMEVAARPTPLRTSPLGDVLAAVGQVALGSPINAKTGKPFKGHKRRVVITRRHPPPPTPAKPADVSLDGLRERAWRSVYPLLSNNVQGRYTETSPRKTTAASYEVSMDDRHWQELKDEVDRRRAETDGTQARLERRLRVLKLLAKEVPGLAYEQLGDEAFLKAKTARVVKFLACMKTN